MGWVVAVDDITPVEQRLGREAVPGNRYRPDGLELRWHQIGIKGLLSDPQLPYFTHWECTPEQHPSTAGPTAARLTTLQIAGDVARVTDWLGRSVEPTGPSDVRLSFVAPHGTPGLMSCDFETAAGTVTV
jgi:hypothetical protein